MSKMQRFLQLITSALRVLRTQGFRAVWMRVVFRLQAHKIKPHPIAHPILPAKKPEGQRVWWPKQQNHIVLTQNIKPHVSIIIVATNLENIQLCLSAISEHRSYYQIEVVVVNNAIKDDKANDLFSKIQGIKLLEPDSTGKEIAEFFNKGASEARGDYFIFIRDYVLLQPNCVNELIDTLKSKIDCGVVGAKLLNNNGYLIEAGIKLGVNSIDKNKENDSMTPVNNYLRAMDYSTGVLAVSRKSFFDVGGFSNQFEAHIEMDLGLRMLKAGYTNYYQPLACAVILPNFLFSSSLEEDVPRANTLHQELLGQQTGKTKKAVLYIDTLTPTPDKDSGSVDAFNHMRILHQMGYHVTFIPGGDLSHAGKYTYDLQRLGIKCVYEPYYSSAVKYLSHHGGEYEIVVICRVNNAAYLMDWVRKYCPRARVIFNTVDLHYLRELRQAEIEQSAEKKVLAYQIRDVEISTIQKSDYTLVISHKEKELLESAVPDANIISYPLIMDIPNRQVVSFEERRDIMFVGGFRHKPNLDAVLYFISDIWPLIQKQNAEIKCFIIGSEPPPELINVNLDGVIVTGHVEDLSEYFNRCKLSIAPLRFGAGIKGKVGRSLGYGVPVIATTIAAEGSGLVDKQDILIADNPSSFAEAVLSIYQDKEIWTRLSKNGLIFFEKNYSLDAGKQFFNQLIRLVRRRLIRPTKHPLTYQICRSRQEYLKHLGDMVSEHRQRLKTEKNLIGDKNGFFTSGYCYVCDERVKFYSDFSYALHDSDGNLFPNWRERMVCPKCELNNRMRAAIQLFEQACAPGLDDDVYLTEQKTPLFNWFSKNYSSVTGSEFLGDSTPYGTFENGIRNETLTGLTFENNVFDSILCFDVFEHIPDFRAAFREALRCLKPGGSLLFTVPFNRNSDEHIVRARVNKNGEIEHVLPPEYHGDPLNTEGVLCFYHFGWDLLNELRNLGFASAEAYLYWSKELGYLGYEQILFMAQKPK